MRRLAVALVVLAASASLAADKDKAHPHKGVLKPYPETFTPVPLTADEKASLQTSKPVFKQIEGEKGGRGVAIFLVDAPPDVTWSTIKQFERYPDWISNVDKIEVYNRTGEKLDVYFEISAMGVGVDYFIAHKFREKNKYATWTLDYTKKSDLDDSVGFWKVDAVDGEPNRSQVTYSVDIKIKGWVPGFIRTLLVDNGLKTATGWVKKQSERRWRAKQGK